MLDTSQIHYILGVFWTHSIRLLRRQVGKLATSHEIVSLWPKRNRHAATKQDEGEDIAILLKPCQL